MATLTVYPDAGTGGTTVDASLEENAANATWATIRDGAGDFVANSDAKDHFYDIVAGATSGWGGMARSIFTLDTAALGTGATISATVFSVYGDVKLNDNTISPAPDMNVYGSTPASNNVCVSGDFAQIQTTAYATALAYADQVTAAYNDLTFNATGRDNISLTGITKLGIRNANYDVINTEPGQRVNSAESTLYGMMADTAGTTTDPKLVVTYTPAPTASVESWNPAPYGGYQYKDEVVGY